MMTMAASGNRSLTKHEREKIMRVFSVLGELPKDKHTKEVQMDMVGHATQYLDTFKDIW